METALATGIGTPREQRFAGQAAAVLWASGGWSISAMQLLPGLPHRPVTLGAMTFGALMWAALCLWVIDWERAGRAMFVVPGIFAMGVIGVGIALTGGAHSPVRFFVIVNVMYFACFYRPADAFLLTGLALAVVASPLLYDRGAVDGPYVGELIVLEFACLTLAVVLVRGKQLLVALRQQAQELALHDPLTELPNRRAMMLWIDAHTGARDAPPIGVVMVDLDGFKAVNTIHGYRAGDEVLRITAGAMAATLREDAMLARLGGDEFAVLLPDADREATDRVAQRLLAAASRVDELAGLTGTPLTASAGRVLFTPGADTVEGVMELADRCLRVAKSQGKNRVVEPADLARAFAQLEAGSVAAPSTVPRTTSA